MDKKLENLKVLINKIEQEIELNEQQIKLYEKLNKDSNYVIREFFDGLINSLKLNNEKLKTISKKAQK